MKNARDQVDALMSEGDGATAFESDELTSNIFEVISMASWVADRTYGLANEFVGQTRNIQGARAESARERYTSGYLSTPSLPLCGPFPCVTAQGDEGPPPFDDPGIGQFMSYYDVLATPLQPLKTIAWVVAHALRPDSITGSVMVLIPVDPALPIFGIGLRGQLTYDRCGRVSVGVGPAAGVGLGISGGVTADWVSPAGNFGGSVNANELQASEEGNAGGSGSTGRQRWD